MNINLILIALFKHSALTEYVIGNNKHWNNVTENQRHRVIWDMGVDTETLNCLRIEMVIKFNQFVTVQNTKRCFEYSCGWFFVFSLVNIIN